MFENFFQEFRESWHNVEDFLTGRTNLEPMTCEALMFRSPELIRNRDPSKLISLSIKRNKKGGYGGNANAAVATFQQADIYSFATVLYDVHLQHRSK